MWNLAKKSQKKNFKKILSYDLGGTKVAVAVIDEQGNILEEKRESVLLGDGPKGLLSQLARLGRPFVDQYRIRKAVIASAGPLDLVRGRLLNATNFKTDGKHWGVVPLVGPLQKKLGITVALENDAAAAALAEAWVGVGKKSQNLAVITLGTGVGVGVVANGELVRAGRFLHPEGGHLIIEHSEKSWLCGCGNYGCAEAFLSGMNFAKNMSRIWGEAGLSGHDLVVRGRAGEEKVLQAFAEYGERLATLMASLTVLFAPEVIVIAGGFSHASDLFLPSCEARLLELMKGKRAGVDLLPKISISKFQDEAGLLGAAAVVFRK